MKIWLGGEGPTELGGWFSEPPYRDPAKIGVLEALLRRIRKDGWSIEGATRWTKIRKFKAGDHRSKEQRNVLGLVLQAKEAGCDAVAFTRDRDRDPEREASINEAISEANDAAEIEIIGGVAVEEIEGWILALKGQRKSEAHSDPKRELTDTDREEFVDTIESADFSKIPDDACSLEAWLERAEKAFAT